MRNKLSNTICVWGERSRLFIHENANMVNTLFNTNSGYIYIDEYTFTGHNVCILTGTHNIYRYNEERMDFPTEGNDIRIGKGVYIASNVTILGPCKVGDNAVIAAGAVVVPGTIIEENAVYAGVPAKLIKKLNE